MLMNGLPAGLPSPYPQAEWPLGREERCVLLHDFLPASECDALIASGEREGFVSANPDYPPSYRDNDRLVIDDAALAGKLFQRLERHLQGTTGAVPTVSEPGWSIRGVNERIRFCRYRPGTQFGAHQDGVHYDASGQSRLTFMVYLNDAEFTGGETVFFASRADAMAGRHPVARLRPRKGSLILFDHALWHAGTRVSTGVKYVMRSDLMYARDRSDERVGAFEPGHQGYIWSLTALSNSTLASAGRDAAIRIWSHDGALLSSLAGHTQSVLGVLELAPGRLVSWSRDRTVRQWCRQTGSSTVIGVSGSTILSAAALAPGRLVTGNAVGQLEILDVGTGESMAREAHESWIWAIATAGDGTFVTAAEDGMVRLWQSATGEPLGCLGLDRPLRSVTTRSISHGTSIAVGDIDGHVHLIEQTGNRLALTGLLKAHQGAVRRTRFKDDRTLLTCGEDGRVCRWDLASRQSAVIATHDNFATDVLSLGGDRYVSCGYDGRLRT